MATSRINKLSGKPHRVNSPTVGKPTTRFSVKAPIVANTKYMQMMPQAPADQNDQRMDIRASDRIWNITLLLGEGAKYRGIRIGAHY